MAEHYLLSLDLSCEIFTPKALKFIKQLVFRPALELTIMRNSSLLRHILVLCFGGKRLNKKEIFSIVISKSAFTQ